MGRNMTGNAAGLTKKIGVERWRYYANPNAIYARKGYFCGAPHGTQVFSAARGTKQ